MRLTQNRQTANMTNPFQYLLRRFHRTTSFLYFRWSHAKALSTFQRSTDLFGGLPLGCFRFGHERRGIMGAISCSLRRFLSSLESYPLSPCIASGRFFGLPGLPVRTFEWSMSDSTCALSLFCRSCGNYGERDAISVYQSMECNPLALKTILYILSATFAGSKRSVNRGSSPVD